MQARGIYPSFFESGGLLLSKLSCLPDWARRRNIDEAFLSYVASHSFPSIYNTARILQSHFWVKFSGARELVLLLSGSTLLSTVGLSIR